MLSESPPTPWPRVVGLVALLSVALSVLITAFGWPAARSEPREVPLVVAGPESAVAPIQERLAQVAGDAFDVTTVSDRDAAVAAIEDREAYGAIVAGRSGPEVLTASAASYTVAQLLDQLAETMAAEPAAGTPRVTDVVSAPADDPRGAGLSAGALPLVFSGLAGGGAFALAVAGMTRRIVGAVGLAVVGGLAMTAIWQFWLGALDGPYLANAGVVGLAVLASVSVLIGLHGLFGMPGFGVGAAILMLLGNPLSGLTTAPEMLPTGWGDLGQLLPPGAAGSLLRSVAFFDGADATRPLVVLLCWVAAGVTLCVVGTARSDRERDVSATPTGVPR
jgi:hypothetical protein